MHWKPYVLVRSAVHEMTECIIGIDQASSAGWAICDRSGVIQAYGVQVTAGIPGMKLYRFLTWLDALVEQQQPILIVHEQPHFRGFSSSFLGCGFAAIIHLVAAKHNVEVAAVHTQELKKWATGSGGASKEDMVRAAEKVIGKNLSVKKDNDKADAIHIARWGALQWLSANQ